MVAVSWFPIMALLLGLGGAMPWGVPPAEEDAVLANVAPEKCLAYLSWAGSAQPDAKSKNQTEQLLAEPEVQKFLAGIERTVSEGLKKGAKAAPPQVAPVLEDLAQWWPKLLARPAALYVEDIKLREDRPEIKAGAVVHLDEDADAIAALLVKHQERLLGQASKEVDFSGSKGYRIQLDPKMPPIFWVVREGYLGIAVGEGVIEGMIERAEGEPPAWLTRTRDQLPIERRSSLSYVNVEAVKGIVLAAAREPKIGQALEVLGLDNITAVMSVSGLDQQGFVSKTLISMKGEAKGLPALLLDKPLTSAELAPIPRDALVAVAVRLSPAQIFDTVMEILQKLDPAAHDRAMATVDRFGQETGVEVRAGLLKPLGDVLRIYLSPSQGGVLPTSAALVMDVDDPDRLKESLAKLGDLFDRVSSQQSGPQIEEMEFKGQKIHFVTVHRPGFPLTPAWCIANKQLIVGLFPQTIKAYLSPDEGQKSLAAVPEVAAVLKAETAPEKLLYIDSGKLFDMVYPLVPLWGQLLTGQLRQQGIDFNIADLPVASTIRKHLFPSVMTARRTKAGIEITSRQSLPGVNVGAVAPVGVALLLPAVQAAREAARRAQSMNNLKQIALAMHNYHDVHKEFPSQWNVDKDGKPLLSWRVQLLPYLEQEALYRQFKLDEPWDSPNNKKLIEKMPAVFRSPNSTAAPGKTNYLGISGPGRFFDGEKVTRLQDITDGTSNTIMVVEANNASAVIWTKPEDYTPAEGNPTAGLTGLRPGGFVVAFCDGSVRFIQQTVNKDVINALFTIAGGEIFELP